MAALQILVDRHRLLFLRHAVPHGRGPKGREKAARLSRAKPGLEETPASGVPGSDTPTNNRGRLEAWLADVHCTLGRGLGAPFKGEGDFYPGYPYWTVTPLGARELAASSVRVIASVGAALRHPLPGWLDEGSASAVRRCAELSLAAPHPEGPPAPGQPFPGPAPWDRHVQIAWEYADRLQAAVEPLAQLVLMESGGHAPAPVARAAGVREGSPPGPAPVPVILGPQGGNPVVLGETVRPLTAQRYVLVAELLNAGEVGLTKDQLERRCGGGARTTLRRLAESHPNWARVIQFAGEAGMRYRIRQLPG